MTHGRTSISAASLRRRPSDGSCFDRFFDRAPPARSARHLQVLNLVLFMFVVMFIFAIIGMQIFGATGMAAETRLHYDTFPAAMISTLTILIGKYVEIYQAVSPWGLQTNWPCRCRLVYMHAT